MDKDLRSAFDRMYHYQIFGYPVMFCEDLKWLKALEQQRVGAGGMAWWESVAKRTEYCMWEQLEAEKRELAQPVLGAGD